MSLVNLRKQPTPSSSKEAVFECRLIEQVRQHPVLYDLTHPDYTTTPRKAAAWEDIAVALGSSVNQCKRRWGSLRDGYRKSIIKSFHYRRTGLQRRCTYVFGSQMSFLKKYLRASAEINAESVDTNRAVDEADPGDESDTAAGDYDADDTTGEPDARTSPVDTLEVKPEPSDDIGEEAVLGLVEQVTKVAEAEDGKIDTKSALLMQYPPLDIHPIDAFLCDIGATLKSLPAYYQALAKADIFAAAHKYKMRSIRDASMREPEDGDRMERSSPGHAVLLNGPGLMGAQLHPPEEIVSSTATTVVKEETDIDNMLQ